MLTLESREEIVIGMEVRFAELWDGNGDGEELLNSKSICVGENEIGIPVIVGFEVIDNNNDTLDTLVKITDIY